MQLKQWDMSVGEYASKFEELRNYYTFFYHPNNKMECIQFKNGLRPELRKTLGILEILILLRVFISAYFWRILKKVKIINRDVSDLSQTKKRHNGGKSYNLPQQKSHLIDFLGNSSRHVNSYIRCLKYGQDHYVKD